MRRRDSVAWLGAVIGWPLGARAQQAKLPRIGVLVPSNPEPFFSVFRQGLSEHGSVEGKDIQFEFRSADGKPELLRGLAEELVRLEVDIIAVWATPAVLAAKKATSQIPIVMGAAQPVRADHQPPDRQGARYHGSARVAHPRRRGDRMRRRESTTFLSGAAAWSLGARAQHPKPPQPPRIGVLVTANPEPFWSVFRQGLREQSYRPCCCAWTR